jgi:hypothetical protein
MKPFRRSFRGFLAHNRAGGARLRVISGLDRFLHHSRPAHLSRSGGSRSRLLRLRAATRTEVGLFNGLGRIMKAHHLTWDFFLPGECPEGLREEDLVLMN